MKSKNLIGIRAFAIWYLALSIWGAFIIVFNIIKVGKIYNPPPNLLMSIREPLVFIILPIAYFISAIGVFKKKEWARLLFVISSAVSLLNLLLIFFVAFLPSGSYVFAGFARYLYIFCYGSVIFLPHIAAIVYFLNPKVKEQFK